MHSKKLRGDHNYRDISWYEMILPEFYTVLLLFKLYQHRGWDVMTDIYCAIIKTIPFLSISVISRVILDHADSVANQ